MAAKKKTKPKAKPAAKAKAREHRSYGPKDRAAALGVLDFNEGNLLKTATMLGLPEATLRTWKKDRESGKDPQLAEDADEFKRSLADEIEETLRVGLQSIRQKLPRAGLYATKEVVSMLAEKHQVINNRPSDIQSVEHRGTKIDQLAGLLNTAAERRAKQSEKK